MQDWVTVGRRLASKDGARLGGKFVKHVAPAIVKPARTLWNEVIGFIFFCLAVPFAFRAYSFGKAGDGRWIPLAVVCFFLLCFSFSSFRRARKISRS